MVHMGIALTLGGPPSGPDLGSGAWPRPSENHLMGKGVLTETLGVRG